jgi:hypothetical protein
MRKILIAAAGATLFALGIHAADSTVPITRKSADAAATWHAGRFGAGILIGEPTGITAKYWLNDTLAFDGALGASLHDDVDELTSFYMHGDILWHKFDLITVPRGKLPVYIGAGVLVRFRDHADNEAGVRIPLGVSYLFDNAPVDIFAEIAPAIDISPAVRGEITGGIGVRFWF